MTLKLLPAFLLCGATLLAQTTRTTITDSNGTQATVTLSGQTLYYVDNQGHSATGTIKDGMVSVHTNTGESTIGTIRNGNVFLNDSKGTTTGTIRDGRIFLNNSDGSTTTGTYGNGRADMTVTTTPSPAAIQAEQERFQHEQQARQLEQQQALDRQRQIDQQNYDAGVKFGQGVGSMIVAGMDAHRESSYCKAHPTATYLDDSGISIQCPQAPLGDWEVQQAAQYCSDHPGLYIIFGRHRVDCLTPPTPINLKWAEWEEKNWQWDYRNRSKLKVPLSADRLSDNWAQWRDTYCRLAPTGAEYKDLDNKKQHCR